MFEVGEIKIHFYLLTAAWTTSNNIVYDFVLLVLLVIGIDGKSVFQV